MSRPSSIALNLQAGPPAAQARQVRAAPQHPGGHALDLGLPDGRQRVVVPDVGQHALGGEGEGGDVQPVQGRQRFNGTGLGLIHEQVVNAWSRCAVPRRRRRRRGLQHARPGKGGKHQREVLALPLRHLRRRGQRRPEDVRTVTQRKDAARCEGHPSEGATG